MAAMFTSAATSRGATTPRSPSRCRNVRCSTLAFLCSPTRPRHSLLATVFAALLCTVAAFAASAADRGFLLVAKPGLLDPNFRQTVVLVAQTDDGAAYGVVLNRPATKSLAELVPEKPEFARFSEPLFLGGPVERIGLFAVFRAAAPIGSAFSVAEDLWLALAPATVERLLAEPPAALRFFVGYAGWAPGQLAAELDRGGWWVFEPDPDVVFRKDTRGLWEELARRAQSLRAMR